MAMTMTAADLQDEVAIGVTITIGEATVTDTTLTSEETLATIVEATTAEVATMIALEGDAEKVVVDTITIVEIVKTSIIKIDLRVEEKVVRAISFTQEIEEVDINKKAEIDFTESSFKVDLTTLWVPHVNAIQSKLTN